MAKKKATRRRSTKRPTNKITMNKQDRQTMRDATGLLNNALTGGNFKLREDQLDVVWNAYMIRTDFLKKINDPRRDIQAETGLPTTPEITAYHYRNYYDRHPIAARVTELFPQESWMAHPKIYEEEKDKEDKEDGSDGTPFEKAWHQLVHSMGGGKSWYKDEENNPIWSILKRLDIFSGIGRYGVLLIGTNDGGDDPAESLAPIGADGMLRPVKYKETRKLTYLRVADEHLAPIGTWETEKTHPRYGLPNAYRVTIQDDSDQGTEGGIGVTNNTMTVHWSRVIHVADNVGTNDILGNPRMLQVYNPLHGLEKLYQGDPEMYWRGAFPGYSLEMDPRFGGNAQYDIDEIKNEAEDYFNSLQRFLMAGGMTVKSLAPQVVDPSPHIDKQLEAIAIRLGCPMRILMGSERGELASSQDAVAWARRMRQRQIFHITPHIIIPFIDRLITIGVLPEPKQWHCKWPEEDHLSETEKAELLVKRTDAASKYVGGQVDTLIPPKRWLVQEAGYTEEEAEETLQEAVDHINDAHPEAEDVVEPGRKPQPPAPVMLGPDGKPLPPPQFPPKPGDDPKKAKKDAKKKGGPTPVGNTFLEDIEFDYSQALNSRWDKFKRWVSSHEDTVGELYTAIWNAKKGGANCGIGTGGFQPGNTCAKGSGAVGTGPMPTNLDGFKEVGSLGGSTGAKLMEDKNGKKWVVKTGNAKILANEIDADMAYRAMGVRVPRSTLVNAKNGLAKVSEYHEGGQTLAQYEQSMAGKKGGKIMIDSMHRKIAKDFAADALLANWDVVGLSKDNILIVEDKGKLVPMRIDNGGALLYRAQGAPKGNKFSGEVGELDSMRNASLNKSAASVFKKQTDLQIAESMETVLSKKKAVLDAVSNSNTKAILEKRFASLEKQLPKFDPFLESTTNPVKKKPIKIDDGPKKKAPPKLSTADIDKKFVSGKHVSDHAATMAKNSGVKMTKLQKEKLAALNPDGIKGGQIILPYVANKKVAQAQLDLYKQIFPSGTKFAITHINSKKASGKEKIDFDNLQFKFKKKLGSGGGAGLVAKAGTKGGVKHSGKGQGIASVQSGVGKAPSFSKTKTKITAENKTSIQKWQNSLSSQERAAVSAWTNGHYSAMRKRIANGTPNATDKALLSALDKAPKAVGGTPLNVYRGVKTGNSWGKALVQSIKEAGVGAIFEEPYPSSTSLKPSVGISFSSGGVLFKIKTKTAAVVEQISQFKSEAELIAKPNVKYRVTKLTENAAVPGKFIKKVQLLVEMEEIK